MKTLKQFQPKLLAAAIFIGLCTVSVGTFAVRPPNAGNGGSGSGSEPPDFGDLFILDRDADGVPILTTDACQQPLAAPGVSLPTVEPYPACTPPSSTESCVIPVDPATCAVVVGYETYTQEVDFGRTSVVRSPISVLDTQLEDAAIKLATADCTTLDPAGRLVTSTVVPSSIPGEDEVLSAAIDSPLQNLAIYKQLMLKGYIGAESAPIALPDSGNPLNTAARGLGAAFDKSGKISLDTVVYLNQILGLTDESVQTLLPKRCIDVKEEVKGVVQLVRKCFLNYGPTGGAYAYDRGSNFGALPSPAYIPEGAGEDGVFEYLTMLDDTIPTFEIAQGPILDAVPELLLTPDLTASNIGGFAQAADDTRAVIEFMHSWPIPGDFATPLTCAASGETNYDVSISPDSGLQVPVKMVAGTEGREFTVTVANAGPDAATGTVQVTAIDGNGSSIPTFPRTFNFTLISGTSQSWTEGFSINYATTVTWTATANAALDVNPANNSVTETTVVTGSKGGGRGNQ